MAVNKDSLGSSSWGASRAWIKACASLAKIVRPPSTTGPADPLALVAPFALAASSAPSSCDGRLLRNSNSFENKCCHAVSYLR